MSDIFQAVRSGNSVANPVGGVLGEVVGVGTSQCDVLVLGSVVPGVYMAQGLPSPAIGQTVLVLSVSGSWLVVAVLPLPRREFVAEGGFERYALGTTDGTLGSERDCFTGLWYGWTPGLAAVVSPTGPHSGSRSLQCFVAQGNIFGVFPGDASGVTAASAIRISAWVRADTNVALPSTLQVNIKTDAFIGSTVNGAAVTKASLTGAQLTSAWRFLSWSGTLPAAEIGNARILRAYIEVTGFSLAAPLAGRSVFLDDISFDIL